MKYKIFITGEITSKAKVDKEKIVKDLLEYFGYNKEEWEKYGDDWNEKVCERKDRPEC